MHDPPDPEVRAKRASKDALARCKSPELPVHTVSTILPIWVLPSMRAWAFEASASG
jgi:hypothetical protein